MELFDLSLLFAQHGNERNFPFNAQDIVAIIAVSAPFALGMLAIIFHYLGKAGRCVVDASLKHRMLRLGYSAADIERVLQADKKIPLSATTNKGKSDIVVAESLKPAV